MHPLVEDFSRVMQRFDLRDVRSIAVAVSGGADSMALTLMAQEWARIHAISLIALTVDHGVRKESKAEAEQVHAWLLARDISHVILREKENFPDGNIQEQARLLRYRLLTRYCRDHHIPMLLVAHTQNDQAETVLMRLLRGSGVDGLSAMPIKREEQQVMLVRPLLEINREKVEAFLREIHPEWIEDPSNQNPRFLRTHVRQWLNTIPQREEICEHLCLVAQQMQRTRALLEKLTVRAFQRYGTWHESYAFISHAFVLELEEEIALRVISELSRALSASLHPPRFESLYALYSALKENAEKNSPSTRTLNGVMWCGSAMQKNKGWWVIRELKPMEPAKKISAEMVEWDQRFYASGSCANSSSFEIDGLRAEGVKQLKMQIKTQKFHSLILPPWRVISSLPACKQLETIVAVPHIGYLHPDYANDVFSLVPIRRFSLQPS